MFDWGAWYESQVLGESIFGLDDWGPGTGDLGLLGGGLDESGSSKVFLLLVIFFC